MWFVTGQLMVTDENGWGLQGLKFLRAYYLTQGACKNDCHIMERVFPKSVNQPQDAGAYCFII